MRTLPLVLALAVLLASCAPDRVTGPLRYPRRSSFAPHDSMDVAVVMAGVWMEDPEPQGIAYVWPDGYADFVIGEFQFWANGQGGIPDQKVKAVYNGNFTDTTFVGQLAWNDLPSGLASQITGTLTARWSRADSIPDSVYADSFHYGRVIRVNATMSISGGPWPAQTRSCSLRLLPTDQPGPGQ